MTKNLPLAVLCMDERLALFCLAHVEKLGPVRLRALKDQFGSYANVCGSVGALLAAPGDINLRLQAYDRLGIRWITILDENYPPLLKEIHAPPPVLFYRGAIPIGAMLAVVGTRRPTRYGEQVAERLVNGLAGSGIAIVSGLAFGIDAIAHQTALRNGLKTIAVLANGLDRVYPTSHERLAEEIIAKGGTIISEFPIGTPALKQHFPQRNRVIAGLAQATLVVEAGLKSGALITSKYAMDEGRDVLAIPGPIFSEQSEGANQLLAQGAKVVRNANDILECYGFQQAPPFAKGSSGPLLSEEGRGEVRFPCADGDSGYLPVTGSHPTTAPSPDFTTDSERSLFALLSLSPAHVDDLVKRSNLPPQLVFATLTRWEIDGLVRDVGGRNYVLH